MTCPSCGAVIDGVDARGPGVHRFDPCGCPATASARDLAGGADRGRGVAADGGRERRPAPSSEILDVVAAPEGECQMWSGGEKPSRCDNDADYLFVYQGSTNPERDVRRNALACEECFSPPKGYEDVDRGHGVAADGGWEPWCDWCQREFGPDGPDWKVDTDVVTGWFCSEDCADSWSCAADSPERVGEQRVATDGGQMVTGYYDGELRTVAGHSVLPANVNEDGENRVTYECQDCGHLSNTVTGFDQRPCESGEGSE